MRHRFATRLAILIGAVLVIISIYFAAVQNW
jgi:hypothetical protein